LSKQFLPKSAPMLTFILYQTYLFDLKQQVYYLLLLCKTIALTVELFRQR